jgi:hypothetical protein
MIEFAIAVPSCSGPPAWALLFVEDYTTAGKPLFNPASLRWRKDAGGFL